METFYKAYTKIVQNKQYYFVKRYLSFPEYKEVEDILDGYGMHTDFNRACDIAAVNNSNVRKRLLLDMQSPASMAKVIELMPAEQLITKKLGN